MTPLLRPLRRTACDAETFARIVHEGQTDKAGRPYVEHVARVRHRAEQMARALTVSPRGVAPLSDGDVDTTCQIALLHDVIEDTPRTAQDLLAEGFAFDVVEGVTRLTKFRREYYAAWIERLCEKAPLPVLLVKIADIEDDSDPARLALLPAETRTRLERKYGPALARLRAAVEDRGMGLVAR